MSLCGELYFKMILSELKIKLAGSPKVNELLTFLSSDNRQKSSHGIVQTQQLTDLQSLRKSLIAALCYQREHIADGDIPLLACRSIEVVESMLAKVQVLNIKMEQLHATVDAHLMDYILSYFEVLKRELSFNRFNVNGDFREINARRKQAELFRNMRYFALCLDLETSSRIKVSSLSQGSTQSRRCMKAVIDNLNPQLLNQVGYVSMDVNAVYKIEHKYFSESLQV